MSQIDTWKYLNKLIDADAIFKIFKQSNHWNASSTKHPGTAEQIRVEFQRRTRAPINHVEMLITPNDGEPFQRVSGETCVNNTGVTHTPMGPTTVGTDGSVLTQMGGHNPQ